MSTPFLKQTFIFLLLALLCLNSADAQQKISTPIKRIPVSEIRTFEQVYSKGVLLELQDSSILFSNSLVKEDFYNGNYAVSKILIEDIKFINTRMSGATGRGMLWGGVIGVSTGVVLGLIEGDNFLFSTEETVILGGVSMGVIGALMGGFTGSIKLKIPINGSMDVYSRNKKKLHKYTVTYSAK